MDISIVLPILASAAAVTASLVKNALTKKNALSMVVITRPDGSKISLETDKTNQDELKKLVEQILRSEPGSKENATTRTE
jgi:precorrin-4 methylase